MLRNNVNGAVAPRVDQTKAYKVFHFEWIGQTLASVCWIASVLTYGVHSAGDWLQLCAASSWLFANIAAFATNRVN